MGRIHPLPITLHKALTNSLASGLNVSSAGASSIAWNMKSLYFRQNVSADFPSISRIRLSSKSLHSDIKCFSHPDAVFTGVETRSSSPVRISRNEQFESNIRGIYPAGEGAGYAGGIVSSAVDGIKVAEAITIQNNSY